MSWILEVGVIVLFGYRANPHLQAQLLRGACTTVQAPLPSGMMSSM